MEEPFYVKDSIFPWIGGTMSGSILICSVVIVVNVVQGIVKKQPSYYERAGKFFLVGLASAIIGSFLLIYLGFYQIEYRRNATPIESFDSTSAETDSTLVETPVNTNP